MALTPDAATAEVVCQACGEASPPGATWCEACGHELGEVPLAACVDCGEAAVDDLGYCLSCGHRQPLPGDHVEIDDADLVAVSDRGRRHQHNEDAIALARIDHPDGETIVLVVCDGVSSTERSADASQAAADAARDELVHRLGADPAADAGAEGLASDSAGVAEALEFAVAAAQTAASACLDPGSNPDPNGAPSTTLVASVIRGATVTTAWVGDSRSYWVGAQPQKLTGIDHEIQGSLVKWLGADSLDPAPDIAQTTIDDDGWIVVCTDGLWRYAAEPQDLSALVARLVDNLDVNLDVKVDVDQGDAESSASLALARSLVAYANEAGGHDNISVALYPFRVAGQHREPDGQREPREDEGTGEPQA